MADQSAPAVTARQPQALCWRTDFMIRQLAGAELDRHNGYTAVRTPANPMFHWGNFLLLDEPPAAADAQGIVEVWRREFPDAHHVAIGVDGVDGSPGHPAVAAALGAAPQLGVTLTTDHVPPLPPAALAAVEMRPLDVDNAAEWAQLMTLRSESQDSTGEDLTYLQGRVDEAAGMIRRGAGAWWGAFVDGVVRSELGIFTDGSGNARYQHVGTHPAFRRRGLTSALVAAAGRWAQASLPDVKQLVILADAGTEAERLYRRIGFVPVEWQSQVYRGSAL